MAIRTLMGLLLGALLCACGQYDVSVNERVVYTPEPLFRDFATADPALQSCLSQAIAYYKVNRAAELHELDCSDSGISDLAGLEVFTGLRRLRLQSNQISSVAPLSALSSLEALAIRDNLIVNPLPLYDMLSLRIVDLRGNTELRCPRPQDLFRVVDLSLPAHCPQP